MMNDVILSAAKNLPCDGQMLHFVQHDNTSNNLQQRTNIIRKCVRIVYEKIS